jgi:SAM-dependent methyltransferase
MDADAAAFVLDALPPAPARILEVGAGAGELAAWLRESGYDVMAIDPAADAPGVDPVALGDLDVAPGSFDAAVAMLSLHHVEPLAESLRTLAGALPAGGRLVIDEFDVERFDERAARWWLDRNPSHDGDPAAIVRHHRDHLHPVARIVAELSTAFELGPPERGPYLYRWGLGPELRAEEERSIAAGELPETGVRLVGSRKP